MIWPFCLVPQSGTESPAKTPQALVLRLGKYRPNEKSGRRLLEANFRPVSVCRRLKAAIFNVGLDIRASSFNRERSLLRGK